MESYQYPIGRFSYEGEITMGQIHMWIEDIEAMPAKLRHAVEGLSKEQLDTPYRPEGWTVRQVVHHLADSHMNALIRFKLALTEDTPAIKPYFEDRWAELADSADYDIAPSLALLDSLHRRWAFLLGSLTAADYNRTFYHPQNNAYPVLGHNVGMYAWHGHHHIAHITSLRKRMGWE